MSLVEALRPSAFRSRPDRIVAAGRALLAASTLGAASLGAGEPDAAAPLAWWLLAAYTIYASAFAAAMWQREMAEDRAARVAHVIDLAVFALLMHLTHGAASPLFGFLIFALINSTLCWHWRGVVWTAVICLTIVLALGVISILQTGAVQPDLEHTLTRVIYLLVATLLLSFLGLYQTRMRDELWRLAAYPAAPATPSGWPVRQALDYAAEVLQARRALLVWSEADEPWVRFSLRENGGLHQEQVPPDLCEPWVAESLKDCSFVSPNVISDGAIVHCGADRFSRYYGPVIHPQLVERFAIHSAISVPVPNQLLDARLFILDDPGFSREALLVAEVAAERIGAMLEQARLMHALEEAAAAAERGRLARDLHDGVLQSLAGTALQLRSLLPLVRSDAEQAGQRLAAIEGSLARQQRELRLLIGELQPGRRHRQPLPGGELAARLQELAAELEGQWGLKVTCRVTPPDAAVDAVALHDLSQLISEAAANAARHGDAGRMKVAVEVGAQAVTVAIEDDGRGFAFTGRREHEALQAQEAGPLSLRERVTARGGQLAVESSPGRTRLELFLPRAMGAEA